MLLGLTYRLPFWFSLYCRWGLWSFVGLRLIGHSRRCNRKLASKLLNQGWH